MNPANPTRIVASFFLTLFIVPMTALIAHGAYPYGDELGKNRKCLECHGSESAVDGRYYVDEAKFSQTTHARIGCRTCHDTISKGHPDGSRTKSSTTCIECHEDVAKQYFADLHSAKAPCGGCHNPHRVYKANETSGDEMNRQCSNCHDKAKLSTTHSRWLPQTDLHLGAVTCVTCHSKAENYVISIYVAKSTPAKKKYAAVPATYADLKKLTGEGPIQQMIDRNRDGYISIRELQMFNKNRTSDDLSLRGMLTPVNPTHSFRRFDDRWNCTFCHGTGPEVMQTSFLCLPQQDGTFRSFTVEKGAVLDALQAIPDFYLIGSTRNPAVDKVGFVILAGGLVMPIGHGFLRFLTRKFRR